MWSGVQPGIHDRTRARRERLLSAASIDRTFRLALPATPVIGRATVGRRKLDPGKIVARREQRFLDRDVVHDRARFLRPLVKGVAARLEGAAVRTDGEPDPRRGRAAARATRDEQLRRRPAKSVGGTRYDNSSHAVRLPTCGSAARSNHAVALQQAFGALRRQFCGLRRYYRAYSIGRRSCSRCRRLSYTSPWDMSSVAWYRSRRRALPRRTPVPQLPAS